ncbi:hypothetical protein [Nocardia asiatica]
MDSNTAPKQPIDIEVALGIYLNGFQSGIASTASALGKGEITADVASELATRILGGMKADPAVLETIRDQIRANLDGSDTGPEVIKLYNWGNGQ